MSYLSTQNRTAQFNGTVTTAVTEINATADGNGMITPTFLSLRNTGSATLYYSTTNGKTWNSIDPGGAYDWSVMRARILYELLLKVVAPAVSTTYEIEAGY